MSRNMSRRGSFVGGNRSLTDASSLPRPNSSDMMQQHSSSVDYSPPGANNSSSSPNKEPAEPSEEELTAMAAYEAISAETGKAQKDIGVEQLHEFLSRFGLMSREALKDEVRVVSGSPNKDGDAMAANNRRTPTAMPGAPPSPEKAPTVAKTDFVDFVSGSHGSHMQQQQLPKGARSAAAAAARRVSQDLGGEGWIDRAVTRAIDRQHKMRGGGGGHYRTLSGGAGSPSSNGMMMKGGTTADGQQNPSVSILDPGNSMQQDEESGDGGDGCGGAAGNSIYGQDMNESLASIEQRLRHALEARSNTPVPGALLLDGEKEAAAAAAAGGSPSPAGRRRSQGRRSNTPAADGSNSRSGITNSMYSPSGSTFNARGASRLGGQNTSMASEGASSPSAVLRRHQQQQLDALLSIRRSGGNILQQRGSASSQQQQQSRRTPSRMAGFSVVTPKK